MGVTPPGYDRPLTFSHRRPPAARGCCDGVPPNLGEQQAALRRREQGERQPGGVGFGSQLTSGPHGVQAVVIGWIDVHPNYTTRTEVSQILAAVDALG